jgi:hypothetical protein
MRKLSLVLMTAMLGVSANAFADDETPPGESKVDKVNEPVKEAAADAGKELNMKKAKGGYGSAGCGLGTLLFEPSNGFTQVFAATTNATSGTQTFGITSGTSNCDGAGYQPGSTGAFIESNRSALAKDIVRGKGATISGLTDVAGCSNTKAVGEALKKNFTTIFPAASASDRDVSESLMQVLKSDASLSCTNLT